MDEPIPAPVPQAAPADSDRSRKIRRVALFLFFVYLALYGTFMAWNVIAPVSMARPVLFGMNLAIVYGFGLIIVALVLALVYARFANRLSAGDES